WRHLLPLHARSTFLPLSSFLENGGHDPCSPRAYCYLAQSQGPCHKKAVRLETGPNSTKRTPVHSKERGGGVQSPTRCHSRPAPLENVPFETGYALGWTSIRHCVD